MPEKRKVTSKYRGVSWHKATNKWRANTRHEHKVHELGVFATEEEAAIAYNKKAKELMGEDAILNEI